MKFLFTFFFLLCQTGIVYGKEDSKELLNQLNNAIDSAKIYDAQKRKKIEHLKGLYNNTPSLSTAQYDITLQLYDAYKFFNFDSAFAYATRLEDIAAGLRDVNKIASSKIKTAFVLLSAGMFKETFDKLSGADNKILPDSLKAEYYTLTARYYLDLASFNIDKYYSPLYDRTANAYLDSALKIISPHSFEYYYYYGLKSLKLGNTEKAYADFQNLLHRPHLDLHQTALVASTLASLYSGSGDRDKAIEYQAQAAIADIRSSTKETFAIFNLAELLFLQGDFKNASRYIEKAIEDATFYGARLRKVQVSSILSIIEGEKINYVERQRRALYIYGAIATFFLVILALLLVVIYKQFQKIKKAKSIITGAHANLHAANAELQHVNARVTQVNAKLAETNTELQQVNAKLAETNTELQELNQKLTGANRDLQELNARLTEAHKIKEEYIGYFFTMNTAFFQKIERWKKAIEQKIADRKLEEAKAIVNNINIHLEKKDLLKSFDKVFLKLFPNFVEEFNALFSEEDQIKLKDGEYLNTDLRIYALIRMGITEHEKIAEILEYSIKTVYTYKTKVKNRTIVPKEEFEKKIMSIKSV